MSSNPLKWVTEITAVCGRGVAYRPHSWAVFAAHCRLKAIGNGDEHRTLGSQSCERAMLTMGTFTFILLLFNCTVIILPETGRRYNVIVCC